MRVKKKVRSSKTTKIGRKEIKPQNKWQTGTSISGEKKKVKAIVILSHIPLPSFAEEARKGMQEAATQ